MQCIVKLRGRGQVTIPSKVIEALSLKKDEILILDIKRPE